MNIRSISKKVIVTLGLSLALGWLLFFFLGSTLSGTLAGVVGDKLKIAADGKIAEPSLFIHARITEILWIATFASALWIALSLLSRGIATNPRLAPSRGLIMGCVLFAALNLFIGVCGKTACFWLLLHDSPHVDNLVQYQIKKNLMDESGDRRRIIIIGNSQANRAIDETLINRESGLPVWVSEMTQPGARGFDLLVLGRDMRLQEGDIALFYVSEISFHGINSGIAVADFMKFRDLRDTFELDGMRWVAPGAVRGGLTGRIMPLYRFRQPLSNRLLAWQSVKSEQLTAQTVHPQDLESHAKSWGPTLKLNEASQFEQRSFERLIDELLARNCRVILIHGHIHPALRREMSSEVTVAFGDWLRTLHQRAPKRVTLLESVRFFQPGAEDFDDLVHLNDAAQKGFTRQLVGVLRDEIE